jgi:hypothetical protein
VTSYLRGRVENSTKITLGSPFTKSTLNAKWVPVCRGC